MVSPDWADIGEKYSIRDIESLNKDYSRYFGPDAKNNIHNDLFNSLHKKNKKGDLHKYSIIQHSSEVLPGIQKKLLDEGLVVHYTLNGRDVYRGNADWTADDIAKLRQLAEQGRSDRSIATEIGRSKTSVKRKRQKLHIRTESNITAGMNMFNG